MSSVWAASPSASRAVSVFSMSAREVPVAPAVKLLTWPAVPTAPPSSAFKTHLRRTLALTVSRPSRLSLAHRRRTSKHTPRPICGCRRPPARRSRVISMLRAGTRLEMSCALSARPLPPRQCASSTPQSGPTRPPPKAASHRRTRTPCRCSWRSSGWQSGSPAWGRWDW